MLHKKNYFHNCCCHIFALLIKSVASMSLSQHMPSQNIESLVFQKIPRDYLKTSEFQAISEIF